MTPATLCHAVNTGIICYLAINFVRAQGTRALTGGGAWSPWPPLRTAAADSQLFQSTVPDVTLNVIGHGVGERRRR